MNNIAVDFHMHSRNGSDGALYSEELAYLLDDLGLLYAALTDHDSILGIDGVINMLQKIRSKLQFIPGIEITTHYLGKTLHLLAYGINPKDTELADFLKKQKDARRNRAVKIVNLLNTDLNNEGKEIVSLDEILSLESEGPITRPDIAHYLVTKGYVQTFQEAFIRWLGKYDVPLQTTDIFETIKFVRDIRGVPIIAHAFDPYISINTVTKNITEQVHFLMQLKSSGLQGVEIYSQDYARNGVNDMSINIAMVDTIGLVTTGGSDFHGGGRGSALLPGITMPGERVEAFLELLNT